MTLTLSLRRARLGLALLATIGIGAMQAALAQNIVAPGANTTTEGNADNGLPFNISLFGINSMRYQQVYDLSDFNALSGPADITAISFRPDAVYGSAFASTLPSVQIDLSTTQATAGTLSSTFASNIGSNDETVFNGPLSLSSADTGPAGGPKKFDITIMLAHPFLYDPSQGNLLLDVRNFGGGTTTQFDAVTAVGTQSNTRVYSLDANAPTGTLDGASLVTQFTFSPAAVPEPSQTVDLVIGLFGLGSLLLRGRRKASQAI